MLDALGLDPDRVLVVVRTPPEVSLYHRHGNPLFANVLDRLGNDPGVQAVVLPRTPAQRDAIRERALPSLVVPEHAVDAQSLIALADLVVSAGRNDESRGRGARHPRVDDVRRDGSEPSTSGSSPRRLAELTTADALVLAKRTPARAAREPRDPELMLDLLLSAL